MKAARLTAASVHHLLEPSDSGRPAETVIADPVLFELVLFELVLFEPVRFGPVLFELVRFGPVLFGTAIVLSPVSHVRRTCISFIYVVQVRCTSCPVRRIVVK
jgi:hypothetical protein